MGGINEGFITALDQNKKEHTSLVECWCIIFPEEISVMDPGAMVSYLCEKGAAPRALDD